MGCSSSSSGGVTDEGGDPAPKDTTTSDVLDGTGDSDNTTDIEPRTDGSPVGEDVAPPPPEPGEFGAPCTDNNDCISGFCVWSEEGYICTEECVKECPEGFSCKGSPTAIDPIFICIPNVIEMCQPCKNDYQCNGGLCVAMNNGDMHCTIPCEDAECPQGYNCDDDELCMPETGTCGCTVSNAGKVRACSQSDGVHVCEGYQECLGGAGWGECSAPMPSTDICDGLDNNCDGQIDEESGAGESCSNDNENGSCIGTILCNGSKGGTCTAPIPEAETCDYIDNDCDDLVDEEFKGADGTYDNIHHCGACNNDCDGSIPNATTLCDTTVGDTPVCIIDSCDEGFYPINAVQCASAVGSLCTACTTNIDCPVPGSQCSALDDGQFCTVPCGAADSCPPGYSCDATGATAGQCTPVTGACSCDGSNTQLQKTCEKTWQDPADPDGPVVTCTGVQQCTSGGWSGCQLDNDVCDGADNDCDGVIDGPWINENGFYNKDTHCGACGNNCLAKPFLNASGYCDLSGLIPICSMSCKSGFSDLDNNPTNGCECQWLGDNDVPDGMDQNCDGIDGEIDNAIFVSKSGDNSTDGSIDAPVKTIQKGIDLATSTGKRDVYVLSGVYSENITLSPGVSIYGGYTDDYKVRDITTYETAILGTSPTETEPAAVNAMNLQGSIMKMTIVDGFTIYGVANMSTSGNSFAVWLVDCGNQVSLRNNVIIAGSGAAGAPGDLGQSGANGESGVMGTEAVDINNKNCSAQHELSGGTGGKNVCGGQNVGGGKGGDSVCPKFDEDNPHPGCPVQNFAGDFKQTQAAKERGQNGNGSAAGAGGNAGWDAYINSKFGPYNNYNCSNAVSDNCSSCLNPSLGPQHGQPGADGKTGTSGQKGDGCSEVDGIVVDHQWQPVGGNNGTDGLPGSGGGGGGAAGGVETWNCKNSGRGYHDVGATGGGGGSGGCGGSLGTGGTGGGGSFAVFTSWTNAPATFPQISDNTLVTGNGGNGGSGGTGGTGGVAGAGGTGGDASDTDEAFCTNPAGEGGNGGNGGHGGGGGGGCGGVSYGIFVHGGGGPPQWKSLNDFVLTGSSGTGGLPGPSLGAPGGTGMNGGEGATNF